MAWVTEELRSDRLRVGDRLPSERTLAETLQVSRSSLREALRVLEALGTIRTSTGSGPQSGTIITAAPEQALTLALSLQMASSQVEHRHVYEMRLLLETWAAEHSEPQHGDWVTAEQLLERMDETEVPVDHFLALDAEFHATLSRAAGNPLISAMMDALRLAIADQTLQRAHSLPDWRHTAARLRREHREILASLRSGDREAAVRQLRDHIRGYYSETAH